MRETQANRPLSSASDSLGARLRSAREARGLSVHKAAQEMHVSDDIIDALEQEDFASLGAPIFVRGHLRNYARLLGLPEDEILAAEHTADKLESPPLITQQPGGAHAFGQRFAMPVISIIVMVLLLVLGVVWWQHRPAEQSAATLAEHAMSTTPQPVMPATPAAASMSPGASASRPVSIPETSTQKPKEKQHREAASAPMAQVEQTPTLTSTAMSGAPNNDVQLSSNSAVTVPHLQHILHAQFNLTQSSWVEVYDASGKRLYYGLARAGDTLNVFGAGPLQVFLGNAPGVSVDMNGAVFNLAPFIHPDNTARFHLGETANNSGPAG